jgi:hypothetical protein
MQKNTNDPGGPWFWSFIAGLTCFIVASGGRVWEKYGDFPLWVPLATAFVGASVSLFIGMHSQASFKTIYYRVGCWAFAGVWATWSSVFSLSVFSVFLLFAACLAAAMLAPLLAPMQPAPEEHSETPSEVGVVSEKEILRLIIKYGNVKDDEKPAVRKIADWTPIDAGSTWRVVGAPGAAFTWTQLRDIGDKLASAMALPVGCPVLAEPVEGGRKNEVDLKVSTRNYLAEPIEYPADFSQLSIKDESPIGRYLDAELTRIDTHQDSGLIVGKKGSGKTTLMQCIILNQLRCPDVLTWAIDLNNGSMAAAVMVPGARGEVQHMPLDWVAVDPEEALRMVNAAIRIAEQRRAVYQSMMVDGDDTVLPVAPNLPQINILVDEGGEVTGDDVTTGGLSDEEKRHRAAILQKLTKAIAKLQRIGRAMCVNVIMSYLRATSDLLPSGIKKQNTTSICGMVYDESEIGHTLGWKKGLNHEDLVQKGQFFLRREGPIKMFKAYWPRPQRIREAVHATQRFRAMCQLDEPSLQAAGMDYVLRWKSPTTVTWLERLRGNRAGVAAAAVHGAPVGQSDFRALATVDPIDAAMQALDDLNKPAPGAGGPPPPAGPAGPVGPAGPYQPPADDIEHTLDEFRDELDKWGTLAEPRNTAKPPAPAPPPPAQPPRGADRSPSARQGHIEQMLERAGDDGMKTGEIVTQVQAAQLASSRDTINSDLRAMEAAGTITQTHPVKGAKFGMWWLTRVVGRQ